MEPDMNEDQRAMFDMAKAFGEENIAAHALAWEKEGCIPRKLWPEVGALGFGGLNAGDQLMDEDVSDRFEALGASVYFKPVWADELTTIASRLVARAQRRPPVGH